MPDIHHFPSHFAVHGCISVILNIFVNLIFISRLLFFILLLKVVGDNIFVITFFCKVPNKNFVNFNEMGVNIKCAEL